MMRTVFPPAAIAAGARRLGVVLTAVALLVASVVTSTTAEAARALPTRVSIAAPSTAGAQASVVVRGKATGRRRAVVLQYRSAKGWVKLKSARTSPRGSYGMTVPGNWTGALSLRVVAPAIRGRKLGVSAVRVVTKPDPKPPVEGGPPGGSADDWAWAVRGVRWNPCEVIDYKVNLDGAPVNALQNIDRAFQLINDASGLSFNYAGPTTKVPHASGETMEDGTILMAWTTPQRVPRLAGSVLGIGSASFRSTSNSALKFVNGGVSLDSTDSHTLADGFGRGRTEGWLLLHELGHVVGLDHVDAPEQVMHPSVGPDSYAQFGAGDLAGMRAVGASNGCL